MIDRLPGIVTTDNVDDVRYFDYAGHVYDLQSVDGYYYSSGIVVHNCRCFLEPRVLVVGATE
jgi:intein/homing endonuclease